MGKGIMEKLHSGEIYNPNDSKVMLEQTKCLTRLYRFNKTKPYQYPKRVRMLKRMFAEIGDMCYIEPPLHANWGGRHIHFGNGVYCNFGCTFGGMDIYVLRASYLPHFYYSAEFYHKQDSLDWDTLLQGQQEWEQLQKYFYSDFYVLTPYRSTTEKKEWTAWEYFDAETDSGVIQAFRLPGCDQDTYMVQLKGINPDQYYTITDIDGVNSFARVKGSALMKGVPIYAENPRTALILYIEACE